jgi:hypothetical protein
MDRTLLRSRTQGVLLALCSVFVLASCGGEDGEETAAAAAPATPSAPPASSPPPPTSGGNRAPTISGTPPTATLQGRQYSFTPTASDADNDALTFRITGRPSWAAFDAATGRLSGTPTQANVGSTSTVAISVTDGTNTTNLPQFNLQVVATATGAATLNWTPPTQNSDGTPLNNLASYRVYFGTSPGNYPNSINVNNPGLATFVVDQLTPATWHFVVTAVNSTGAESERSNEATKRVL